MSTVTWIHLSDLHFGKNGVENFEQKTILNELHKDITQQIQEHNIRVDFIFFTGDITFRGNAGAYTDAIEFLNMLAKSANISKENVIMVPGNHDIERSELLSELPTPKVIKKYLHF